MRKLNCGILFAAAALISSSGISQGLEKIDLQTMLRENKITTSRPGLMLITDRDYKGVSGDGIMWLRGLTFSEGTIDVDLKGKDDFQKSFLGIAFHGVDSSTYDLVYFRPFNFRATDPVRKIHAVQYVSPPEYTWEKLRRERNGEFEKAIEPPPVAEDWFHATIVVRGSTVTVFVNHQKSPSLTIQKLNSRNTGMIGLWSEGKDSQFANLEIH